MSNTNRKLSAATKIAQALHYLDPETGAIFYETTPMLLQELGIESLDQLPPLSPLLDDGAEGFDDVS